jgi:polyisoprenoid-binding protein YceI
MTLALALSLALALAAGATPASAATRTFAVKPGSELSYRVVHRLHSVDGRTSDVEGRARVLGDGSVQVMIRAPVASFDSGNGNRDAHMREVTDAARFPFVVVKAAGGGAAVPASFPAEQPLTLAGELTFHGVTRPVEVPVTIRWQSGERATVEGGFPISLEAFGVERPSLMFVKVEDRVNVRARLALEVER